MITGMERLAQTICAAITAPFRMANAAVMSVSLVTNAKNTSAA
jgi:hypothetical protein